MTSADSPIASAFRAWHVAQMRPLASHIRQIAESLTPLSQDARCALECAADSIDNAIFALNGTTD